MIPSEKCAALVREFEGCRLTPYQDVVGVLTVGYGHVVPPEMQDTTITQPWANELLLADLAKSAAAVNRLVKVPVTQNEFDALVSFTFNLGEGHLAGSTLLKLLNAGDKDGAADEFVKWSKAGGKTVAGLLRRRSAERQLFMEI